MHVAEGGDVGLPLAEAEIIGPVAPFCTTPAVETRRVKATVGLVNWMSPATRISPSTGLPRCR